jgi:hypothetical protein
MLFSSISPAMFIVTGDFTSFNTDFLEVDYGMSQLVTRPTHGNNIIDKYFTSRPDLFQVDVFKSLIKTKHLVVHVSLATVVNNNNVLNKCKGRKSVLYDLRSQNIDSLRYALGVHDWSLELSCSDIQPVYDNFVRVVLSLVKQCIPVKNVRLGRRDPDYITPLIKNLLNQRNKLIRLGKKEASDELARKINVMIADAVRHRLDALADSGVRELWHAVKAKKCVSDSSRISRLTSDVDVVNKHFANISYDPTYNVDNVNAFRQDLTDGDTYTPLYSYEVELMLNKLKKTAAGGDNIPHWVFSKCSFELADIVAHIFNCSLSTGILPVQWLSAVVTPVPKNTNPLSLSDFRPISVTPILSRVVEKLIVNRWLRPAINPLDIADQFGFRPTGSTTCALVYFMHHVTKMLETNSYVRCLLIDFSKAFDIVDHVTLLEKLHKLHLPDYCLNWIISFLTGRTHTTKNRLLESSPLCINRSIIQGSGIGPTLYIILESDLKSKSQINVIFKYADDTNLLVPQHTDIHMKEEFEAIALWASNNKMIINIDKTKEIVFRRPNPRMHIDDVIPIFGIEQVFEAKLLGVIFNSNLRFCSHLNFILKQCSQRSFILKQLRCQGLTRKQLSVVFEAIIVSRLRYALPAWAGFLTKDSQGRIDSFLRRMYIYGYCCQRYYVCDIIANCDEQLFKSVSQPSHCLNQLLYKKSVNIALRSRGHNYVLPSCVYECYKNSFVNRCLFNYV